MRQSIRYRFFVLLSLIAAALFSAACRDNRPTTIEIGSLLDETAFIVPGRGESSSENEISVYASELPISVYGRSTDGAPNIGDRITTGWSRERDEKRRELWVFFQRVDSTASVLGTFPMIDGVLGGVVTLDGQPVSREQLRQMVNQKKQ